MTHRDPLASLTKEQLVEIVLLGPGPKNCRRCGGNGRFGKYDPASCEWCSGSGREPRYRTWMRARVALGYGAHLGR